MPSKTSLSRNINWLKLKKRNCTCDIWVKTRRGNVGPSWLPDRNKKRIWLENKSAVRSCDVNWLLVKSRKVKQVKLANRVDVFWVLRFVSKLKAKPRSLRRVKFWKTLGARDSIKTLEFMLSCLKLKSWPNILFGNVNNRLLLRRRTLDLREFDWNE